MSSPKHCAQLHHTTHVGSLSPRAPRTPSVSGPLAPCPRMAMTSCRTCRPRALCASTFPGLRSALDTRPRPCTVPPPFFLLLGTRPSARLPRRANPLSSPLFPPPLAYAGSAPWSTLSPQREPAVYPIHAVSTSGALRPISVRHYKMPWVLALLLHPYPSRIQSRATRSSRHCGTRFV